MFKIISKRRYDILQKRIVRQLLQLAEKESEIEKLNDRNNALNENCNELYKEVKRIENELAEVEQQLTNSELRNITDYCIVKTDDYPCDKCKLESDTCKKLHFHNQTICVVPKENVNSFRKKTKK